MVCPVDNVSGEVSVSRSLTREESIKLLRDEIASIVRAKPSKRDLGLLKASAERLSARLSPTEREKDRVLHHALALLFDAQELNAGTAGDLSGLGRVAFLVRCADFGVNACQTTVEDYRKDKKTLKKWREDAGGET